MELNASDTRSKNSLKEVVAESLDNTSIKDFCYGMSVVGMRIFVVLRVWLQEGQSSLVTQRY